MKHRIPMGAMMMAIAALCMGQTTAPGPEGKLLSPSAVVENLDKLNWQGGRSPTGIPGGGSVDLLRFSADGKEVLFTREITGLKVADALTGKVLREAPMPEFLNSLTVSNNGKLIAGGTNMGKVHIWDAAGMTPLKEFQIGKWSVYAVAMTPDGRLLAADTGEGPVLLWDVEKGRQITELAEKNGDRSADLQFSPDGKLLAAYSCAGRLQIWETTGGKRPDDIAAMVQGLSSEDFATREAAQNQLDAMGADQLALLEEIEKTAS